MLKLLCLMDQAKIWVSAGAGESQGEPDFVLIEFV
jgi:hypothetical protein